MKILRIKESCLYVEDLNRSRQFYEGKLGLPCFSLVPDRHAFFRAGESVLLCFNPENTRNLDSLPPHYGSGKHHLAFECSPEGYQAWKDKLADAEIPITHEQEWTRELKSFYFEDPDGHVLEIAQEGIWD